MHVLFIHLPPPGSAPPPFLSNSSIPLCPLLSLFSPLCHFSLEALVLTSSSALTSAFSLPLFFRTLFALFLFSFFSLLPLHLNLHLYFFCSPGIFCLWAAVSLLYTEEYLLSVILFCMLFFSHSLCVGGALPPPSSFFSFSSAPSPYQA